MIKENETIADIIAEMRRYATDYYGRTIENGGEKGNPGMFYLDMAQFAKVNADRLEAAHRREMDELRKQVGDVAKLREALSKSCAYSAVVLNTGMFNRVHLEALLNMAKAALAAPARNCDRFANAVEAMAELKRVHSWCAKENRRCLEDCPDCGKEWCSLAWLFAPATESEAAK